MVKNHSRKTKKRGGRKYHIGGGDHNDAIPYEPVFYEDNDTNVIPPNSVSVIPNPNKIVDYIPPSTDLVEPSKSSELQFQFTRHVLSCNNTNLGKVQRFGKDFEPGATS